MMFAATDISESVRRALLRLPRYGVFDNLTFRVDGTEVTLAGQARDPKLKSSAEKAVRKIEGVSSVDNQIEVLPLSSSDDWTATAVYRAIYSMPTLPRFKNWPLDPMYNIPQSAPPIHVIVENGNVTLEGLVANEWDKKVAAIAVNGVGGVHKVTNNLRTESGK